MTCRNGLQAVVFTLVFTGCIGATESAFAVSRDWMKNPAVVQMNTAEDIFAIGDAHGDVERLTGVLAAAKLIDRGPNAQGQTKWTGGKSVLVITGDLIDKWPHSLAVIALVRALQKDAAPQGGHVIVTMGNHEAEFLAQPLGKKTKEFSTELTAAGMDPAGVANCGGDIGEFLCALPIAVKINDWFFSHGGNTNRRTIAKLSGAIEAGFSAAGFSTEELIGNNSILEARLNKKGPGGLPWFQAGNSSTNPRQLLAKYAAELGVAHIVQGHQFGKVKFPDGRDRKMEDFFQRYGILFLIDSGMSSRHKGRRRRRGSGRRQHRGRLARHRPGRRPKSRGDLRQWPARNPVESKGEAGSRTAALRPVGPGRKNARAPGFPVTRKTAARAVIGDRSPADVLWGHGRANRAAVPRRCDTRPPMRLLRTTARHGFDACGRHRRIPPVGLWPASLLGKRLQVRRCGRHGRFAWRLRTHSDSNGSGGNWLTANLRGSRVQVLVRDNNVDQALKALKKKMQREGIFREMKLRGHYEKPSEKKAREKAEGVTAARKLARKRAQREGWLPVSLNSPCVPVRLPAAADLVHRRHPARRAFKAV